MFYILYLSSGSHAAALDEKYDSIYFFGHILRVVVFSIWRGRGSNLLEPIVQGPRSGFSSGGGANANAQA